MSRAAKSGTTVTYDYDGNGLRTYKIVNGTRHDYIYASGQLLRESYTQSGTTYTLDFLYDQSSRPYMLYLTKTSGSGTPTSTPYYYILNLQGDVVKLVNSPGAVVAAYTYDAYGNILTATGTLAATNPLRYRGYYYDTETGLYYVSSRYYDPEICRFINADAYVSTGQGVLSYNMFAYCLNNPVNMQDPSGEIAITTLILIGSIVAGCLAAGHTAATSYKYTGKVDVGNTILSGVRTFAFCYTWGMSAYGMYVSYCDYKGYTPVTNVGSAKANPAPYSNLSDPKNVAPGKDFTASQKSQIIEQNKINNNGVVKSDLSGNVLVQPQKSMKGITPSPNEWQIDHIIPKSIGGTNSFSNAQVLSREENRIKWDN